MAKTATINMLASPETKADAESIFSSLGMTLQRPCLPRLMSKNKNLLLL